MIAFARRFDTAPMSSTPMSDRVTPLLFASLAAVLLLLTLVWQVPMMLWDHLDLVPIYAAWHIGRLDPSTLFAVHGGHLHALAYCVLLQTTSVSDGHPWLDGVASWVLLVLYAAIVMSFSRTAFVVGRHRRAVTAVVLLLALYPGHLSNLQWGWQVAVFLCLLGVAIAIRMLTLAELSWSRVAVALAATIAALLSFATAAALIPTAIVLIALRHDLGWRLRIAFAAPWFLLGAGFVMRVDAPATSAIGVAHGADVLLYTLNFLGAGIARFATDLAPWLALAGLVSAAWAWRTQWRRVESLPWLGFALFAAFAGMLVALGRAASYGDSHAFVTRYVSFSSLFWIGWIGLIALRRTDRGTRFRTASIALVATFAIVNAAHMTKKAYEVGTHAATIAATIRSSYPDVDRVLLGEIYFGEPDVALARLGILRSLGFAPFDRPPDRDGTGVN